MRIGQIHNVSTSYYSTRGNEPGKVAIKVFLSFMLEDNIVNPCISITGINAKNDVLGCVYVGEVIESAQGFFKGARVIAIGISNCGIDTSTILADPKVVDNIPEDVTNMVAIFAGCAAKWINMIKKSNPPLGSIIRVGGNARLIVETILKKIGYVIADNEEVADYFFPTDKAAKGDARAMIHWTTSYGEGWNDQRILSNKCILPVAYVNNSVIDNLRTFWGISSEMEFSEEIWPYSEVHSIQDNEEKDICTAYHLKNDKAFFMELSEGGPDFYNRKKSASVFVVCGIENNKQKGVLYIKKTMALIGSIPEKVTMDRDCMFITIQFQDGSVATIQFMNSTIQEYTEMHFDGKSIIVNGSQVKAFGCSGIGDFYECSQSNNIEQKRNQVVDLYINWDMAGTECL